MRWFPRWVNAPSIVVFSVGISVAVERWRRREGEWGEREGKDAIGISAGNSDVGYSGVDAEDAAGDSWRSTLLGDTEGEGDVFDFLLVCARRPFSWKSSSPPATR